MAEKTITVRLSESERELLKEAAWLRKVSLQEWTHSVLLATARQTKKQVTAPSSTR